MTKVGDKVVHCNACLSRRREAAAVKKILHFFHPESGPENAQLTLQLCLPVITSAGCIDWF